MNADGVYLYTFLHAFRVFLFKLLFMYSFLNSFHVSLLKYHPCIPSKMPFM